MSWCLGWIPLGCLAFVQFRLPWLRTCSIIIKSVDDRLNSTWIDFSVLFFRIIKRWLRSFYFRLTFHIWVLGVYIPWNELEGSNFIQIFDWWFRFDSGCVWFDVLPFHAAGIRGFLTVRLRSINRWCFHGVVLNWCVIINLINLCYFAYLRFCLQRYFDFVWTPALPQLRSPFKRVLVVQS